MNEAEFAGILTEALELWREKQIEDSDGKKRPEIQVRSFTEACLLTDNEGIVVNLDGTTFQVQVLEDRR